MLAVVVDELQGDPKDLAQRAVEVLGGTAYDVRASLTVPGGGPAVLAVVAEPDRAQAYRAGLEARGIRAAVVSVRADRPDFDVRRFSLGPTSLEVEDREGRRRSVPYASVDVLIRASAVQTTVSTKTVRERKFNPVRSVLSGGLVNTSVKVTKKTQRDTDSDELLFLYTGGALPLRLSERTLQYQGLGDALQPSRMANFLYMAKAIVTGCPRARVDERLRRRSFQSQLLGRTLSPDDHLDFAVHLVAQSLQRPLPSQPRL
ncbi:MAG: hypothetical protein KUG77_22600 [Nannocystaceae bacterium]|nr:hypothetical protein [Nannocystaceae bacterium]